MLLEPAAPAPARRAGEASGELDLDASTEAPYLDALRAYAAGDPVRLTVPGHKGGAAAPPALARALEDALALDVPALIEGVDLGPAPTPLAACAGARRRGLGRGAHLTPRRSARSGDRRPDRVPRAARGTRAPGRRPMRRARAASSLRPDLLPASLPHWLAPTIDRDCWRRARGSLLRRARRGAPRRRTGRAQSRSSSRRPTHGALARRRRARGGRARADCAALVVDEAWGGHLAVPPRPARARGRCRGRPGRLWRAHSRVASVVLLHHGADGERWLPAVTRSSGAAALAGPI